MWGYKNVLLVYSTDRGDTVRAARYREHFERLRDAFVVRVLGSCAKVSPLYTITGSLNITQINFRF